MRRCVESLGYNILDNVFMKLADLVRNLVFMSTYISVRSYKEYVGRLYVSFGNYTVNIRVYEENEKIDSMISYVLEKELKILDEVEEKAKKYYDMLYRSLTPVIRSHEVLAKYFGSKIIDVTVHKISEISVPGKMDVEYSLKGLVCELHVEYGKLRARIAKVEEEKLHFATLKRMYTILGINEIGLHIVHNYVDLAIRGFALLYALLDSIASHAQEIVDRVVKHK